MIKHTADVDTLFDKAFLRTCEKIKCSPRDLLGVMFSESGCRSSAHNPNGGASGLIQFMPDTLKGLGFKEGGAAFRHLTASQQLRYVEAYFVPWHAVGRPWDSAGRLYQAVFLPGTLKVAKAADDVLCERVGKKRLGWAYEANTVLDVNGDGRITIGDLTKAVMRSAKGARWSEMLVRLGLEKPNMPIVNGIDGAIDTVEEMQYALTKLGFELGAIDGIVGKRTRDAARAFQKRAGLAVDGIIGPKTIAALELAIAEGLPVADPTASNETVPSDTGDEVEIAVE